jgi:glycerol-3-phosphate dehydrogenase (NAD(P)+)
MCQEIFWYPAPSKCIFEINQAYGAEMPIATAIYQILWKHVHAANGFAEVEKILF